METKNEGNLFNFIISTVPADGLSPAGTISILYVRYWHFSHCYWKILYSVIIKFFWLITMNNDDNTSLFSWSQVCYVWGVDYSSNTSLFTRRYLTSIGNPIVEIRRSSDRHISTMGFPILVRLHLYIEAGPRSVFVTIKVSTIAAVWYRSCRLSEIWVT